MYNYKSKGICGEPDLIFHSDLSASKKNFRAKVYISASVQSIELYRYQDGGQSHCVVHIPTNSYQ